MGYGDFHEGGLFNLLICYGFHIGSYEISGFLSKYQSIRS